MWFLEGDQRELAELFGGETGDDVDKFAQVRWREVCGVPVLEECRGWFVGEIVDRYEPGDRAGLLLKPLVVGRNVPRLVESAPVKQNRRP